MTDKLDFLKQEELQTRDGRAVRIYATDCGGLYPNHGAVLCDGVWLMQSWSMHGKSTTMPDSRCDLIRKPQRVTGWVNVYVCGSNYQTSDIFKSCEKAKELSSPSCIGQIYIDADIQA